MILRVYPKEFHVTDWLARAPTTAGDVTPDLGAGMSSSLSVEAKTAAAETQPKTLRMRT